MRSFDLVTFLTPFLSIRLIVTIICHEEPEKLRNRMARKKGIPESLLQVVQNGKGPEFALIHETIWDLLDCENLMVKLDGIEFFDIMLRKGLLSDVKDMRNIRFKVAERFGELMWVDGFGLHAEGLKSLLQKSDAIAQKAMMTTLVLSAHQEARSFFRTPDCMEVLKRIRASPQYREEKQRLLSCLSQCMTMSGRRTRRRRK
jgi:hypothetical protein